MTTDWGIQYALLCLCEWQPLCPEIPDNFADLYQLPAPVLDQIRATISGNFFARLEGPSRIALLAYDNHAVVVESFRDEAAESGW